MGLSTGVRAHNVPGYIFRSPVRGETYDLGDERFRRLQLGLEPFQPLWEIPHGVASIGKVSR
jgi:hypothetical protein